MTGRDAVRDAVLDDLAFVLHDQGCGEVCVCVDDAHALLPVVDRIANQRAAAALEAAADELPTVTLRDPHQIWLRARAAALRASNGAGTTT